jgi:exodeoxyribonuclease V alpha subunit
MYEETMTIHRALKLHGWLSKKTYRFVENRRDMIEASIIIIDEASMLDLELLAHLFRAIQWAVVDRLILVGDRNQLPPIGYGRPFFDTIHYLENEHKGVVKHLTINCRQIIQQTNILKLASMYTETPDKNFDALLNKIEKGQPLGDDMEVIFWKNQKELTKRLQKRLDALLKEESKAANNSRFSLDNLLDIRGGQSREESSENYSIDYFQILSPYRGEYFGTNALNAMFQTTYRSDSIDRYGFLEGFTTSDKIIQVVNNTIYSYGNAFDVYNGQLGYVYFVPGHRKKRKAIGVIFSQKDGEEASIWYPKSIIDQNLELGYAITVHKSQGSEFQIVFLVLPREETGLITRELLYTALTRSRKKLVLFLQKDIMPLMSARHSGKSAILLRNTSLFKFRFTSEKYRFNDLIHRTSKGEYVRSKSELAIANMLWDRNIYYKYEQPLYSKDGTEWKLPDFTIRTEDDETYYWEHLGRLENDPQYAEDWEEKKKWYKRNGYIDNLIWSDEIGGFDSKKIEEIIREKIGV